MRARLTRDVFKAGCDLFALLLAAPASAACYIGSLLVGRQKAFAGWSQAMSLWPGLVGVYLRRAFYRLAASGCGSGCCITFGTVFSHPTVRLGRNVYLGAFCVVGDATLEDDVLVGSHVSIVNGGKQHGIARLDIPVREQPGEWPRITIGRDTWIGDRAVILADVGRHCVVGAGSVVTRPLPDYAIAVGNPARIVRYRQRADSSAGDGPAADREWNADHGDGLSPESAAAAHDVGDAAP